MSILDILIILGCLAGGYWIVNSVMGPGVDITRRDRHDESPEATRAPSRGAPPALKSTPAVKQLPHLRHADWHLLLDVSRTATRAEIEAAYKRQMNKALAARDTHQQEQLRLARDAALAESRPGAR
ncbi:MAG: hypothetical protein U1F39_15495 [Steroidobacteraceae bacterium]